MSKILKKTFKQYNGNVYDLTIENSHSFNIEGKSVHNSGAGSLLSYILEITQVDPLRWSLSFERFMRTGQKDMPDLDIDYSRPMELKEFLIQEWGKENVIPISNFSTMQLKSLIKDISKFYDVPFQEVNETTTKMMLEATP